MDGRIEVIERDGFLEARYLGVYSLQSYKTQMADSVRACLDRKLDRLLVNITELLGYAPSTTDRYEIGKHGSDISRTVKVAALGTLDQLGDAFASTVARNRGVAIRPFIDREKAIAWLAGTEE